MSIKVITRKVPFWKVLSLTKDTELNTDITEGADKNLLINGSKASYRGGGWWRFTTYDETSLKWLLHALKNRYNFDGFSVINTLSDTNGMRYGVMYGCDGIDHAAWHYKEWVDDRGQTTYAEDLRTLLIGRCDGSCKKAKKNIGGFLYIEHP